MDNFIYVILVGGLAGWIAGIIVKGGGSGMLINIVLGIIGAYVGNYLLRIIEQGNGEVLGIRTGNFGGDLVSSILGAVVILFIARALSK